MSGHGHSHGHCEHEAQEQPSDLGIEYSLYTKIDTENVQCLNEAVEGSGKKIFKPWEKRLDTNEVLCAFYFIMNFHNSTLMSYVCDLNFHILVITMYKCPEGNYQLL